MKKFIGIHTVYIQHVKTKTLTSEKVKCKSNKLYHLITKYKPQWHILINRRTIFPILYKINIQIYIKDRHVSLTDITKLDLNIPWAVVAKSCIRRDRRTPHEMQHYNDTCSTLPLRERFHLILNPIKDSDSYRC
jgi:hypothetical protein